MRRRSPMQASGLNRNLGGQLGVKDRQLCTSQLPVPVLRTHTRRRAPYPHILIRLHDLLYPGKRQLRVLELCRRKEQPHT